MVSKKDGFGYPRRVGRFPYTWSCTVRIPSGLTSRQLRPVSCCMSPSERSSLTTPCGRCTGKRARDLSPRRPRKPCWRRQSPPPLIQKFSALGVEFDLSQATQSTLGAKITVCNTQKRLDEVKRSIRTILANDRLSTPVAAQLRGRLVFANAQAFGKCGALDYHLLCKRADAASNVEALDSDLE